MDKESIVAGFKTALLWLNDESLDNDVFSPSSEQWIHNVVTEFIADTKLDAIFHEFTHTSAEHSLSEQIGYDLYFTVSDCGVGFWDNCRDNIYNGHGDTLSTACETVTINNIWTTSKNLIEIE